MALAVVALAGCQVPAPPLASAAGVIAPRGSAPKPQLQATLAPVPRAIFEAAQVPALFLASAAGVGLPRRRTLRRRPLTKQPQVQRVTLAAALVLVVRLVGAPCVVLFCRQRSGGQRCLWCGWRPRLSCSFPAGGGRGGGRCLSCRGGRHGRRGAPCLRRVILAAWAGGVAGAARGRTGGGGVEGAGGGRSLCARFLSAAGGGALLHLVGRVL